MSFKSNITCQIVFGFRNGVFSEGISFKLIYANFPYMNFTASINYFNIFPVRNSNLPDKLKTVMSWAFTAPSIIEMQKNKVAIFFIKVDFKGRDKKQVNG